MPFKFSIRLKTTKEQLLSSSFIDQTDDKLYQLTCIGYKTRKPKEKRKERETLLEREIECLLEREKECLLEKICLRTCVNIRVSLKPASF